MAKIADDFRIAIESMIRRKIRSFLTILAIVIGIGSVVALIGIGNGLQNSINEQFEMMGTNKILVTPGGGYYGLGSGAKLTDDDVNVIERVGGVESVSGWIYKLARAEHGDKLIYTFVMGADAEKVSFEEIVTGFGIGISEGRVPRPDEKYSAMVGCLYAKGDDNFFGEQLTIGDKIDIEGKEFKIVGIASCVGNPQDDHNIYVNIEAIKELYNIGREEYDLIMVITDEGKNLKPIVEEMEDDLRDLRDLEEGEEDFNVQTVEQLMEVFTNVFGVVVVVVSGIAAISLLVGAVGIANTMFTSVLERTREIGAMKAVGATNQDIMFIIMFESGLLGLFGGAVGIGIGYAVAKTIGFIITEQLGTLILVRFSPIFIIGLLMFSFLLGILSGVIPAYRASKMNPVDALRYE